MLKSTQTALFKHERGVGFLVSKLKFNLKISSERNTLPVDPVFSSWVNVIIKKAPFLNRF